MRIHRVKNGESIYTIAREYCTHPLKIMLDNEIESPKKLAEGREILILTPTRTYTVKRGDTLEAIANRFNVSKSYLYAQNPELYEAEKLYQGQLITVKNERVSLGVGIANGYLYPGYKRERVLRCIPYLTYLTVCNAIFKDGKISTLFDDAEALEIAAKYSKNPILRIYTTEDTNIYTKEFYDSMLLLTKSRGYEGITLTESAVNRNSTPEKMTELKKKLIDSGLTLTVEKDLKKATCCDIADTVVLCYDKLHEENIPSFKEGEEKAMTEYAEACGAESSFIELSPFGYTCGKYKEKSELLAYADKKGGIITCDEDKKILSGTVNQGRRKTAFITTGLDYTRAVLENAAELGYLGISFDIMRTPLSYLTMYNALFKTAVARYHSDFGGM